jgi:hypothetical protein
MKIIKNSRGKEKKYKPAPTCSELLLGISSGDRRRGGGGKAVADGALHVNSSHLHISQQVSLISGQ